MKKQILIGLLAAVLSVGTLAGCSGDSETASSSTSGSDVVHSIDFDSSTSQKVSLHGITFEVPESWEYYDGENDESVEYRKTIDDSLFLSLSVEYADDMDMDYAASLTADEWQSDLESAAEDEDSFEYYSSTGNEQYVREDGGIVTTAKFILKHTDADIRFYSYHSILVFEDEDMIFTCSLFIPVKDGSHFEDWDSILDSIQIDSSALTADTSSEEETSSSESASSSETTSSSSSSEETSSESTSSATSTASTTTSTVTTGERNALSEAKSYLKYSAFSYSGLIDQLEYEGYTTAEATYAVDNCGADWDEQALDCAESYLKYSAFSYSGLIDQLEYEGFTTSQATYGADNCGADWDEQAAKCAESYLKYSSFSRSGLIDQLEYEGFTHAQAVYGVEANGY